MSVVITVLHVIVCVFLIAVVLLQRGKGAQVGAVFGGGGGATMFGGRGAGNFLTKLTTGAAVVFMLTSLALAYMHMQHGERLFQGGALEEGAGGPGHGAVRGDRQGSRRGTRGAGRAASGRKACARAESRALEKFARERARFDGSAEDVRYSGRPRVAAVAELVDAPA